jgi:hypothetical protein
VWPQTRLTELVRGNRVGARPQRAVSAKTLDARRSNSSASSLEILRWRRLLCACVNARANVREAALGLLYFLASATAVSRSEAMPVENESRTDAPGTSLILGRRLRIGSSTMPVVPDNARPSSEAGRSASRPRPRNRARSVSHSTGPCGRPSRLRTWIAHTGGSRGSLGRRWQMRAALSGR